MQRVTLSGPATEATGARPATRTDRHSTFPGARYCTARMHTTEALPDMLSDTRSENAQCPLAARDWTRSMMMPSHGKEVQDDRVAAVELREADEEAILDALDVVQLSIDSTHLRTGGARRVSNTQSCAFCWEKCATAGVLLRVGNGVSGPVRSAPEGRRERSERRLWPCWPRRSRRRHRQREEVRRVVRSTSAGRCLPRLRGMACRQPLL
jgi:hypothetical protein